jgi:hypothetical protein
MKSWSGLWEWVEMFERGSILPYFSQNARDHEWNSSHEEVFCCASIHLRFTSIWTRFCKHEFIVSNAPRKIVFQILKGCLMLFVQVIEYYSQKGVVARLQAEKSASEVTKQIQKALSSWIPCSPSSSQVIWWSLDTLFEAVSPFCTALLVWQCVKLSLLFHLSLLFLFVKRISTDESVLAPVSRGAGEVSSYIVLATSLVTSLLRNF